MLDLSAVAAAAEAVSGDALAGCAVAECWSCWAGEGHVGGLSLVVLGFLTKMSAVRWSWIVLGVWKGGWLLDRRSERNDMICS